MKNIFFFLIILIQKKLLSFVCLYLNFIYIIY